MSQRSAIIIGAGIVGLATARALAIRGYRVTVFERNETQTGASVRNFGMIWPVGQPAGELFERAMLSRSIWKAICEEAGIWRSETGSLHLAYHDDELQVLNEYTEEGRSYRNCQVLTSQQAVQRSAWVRPHGLKGALWSETEMIVDARKAIRQVADYLAERYNVQFYYNTAISEIRYPKIFSGKRHWEADEIFVCSGSDFETLYPEIFLQSGITKCKLQMMRLLPKAGSPNLGPSLCGGLSLIHYAGFKAAPSLPRLQKRYAMEMPDFLRWGIHVMVTQNGDGELVVGDSHEYGLAHDPFDKAFINRMVMDYLQRFVQVDDQELSASWNGIYAKMTNGQTEFIANAESGVTILNGLGGAGITLSFGLAEKYIANRHSASATNGHGTDTLKGGMKNKMPEIQKKVNDIFALYTLHGGEAYGEGVSQLMHMVQAGNLALTEGCDDEMVLAAFFHDIGHLLESGQDMDIYGKHDHDRLGHDYLLQQGFSQRLARLVASHVPAKRYLTFKDAHYYASLSDASKITLGFQGGPMTGQEAAKFEKDPLVAEYIRIRRWDDLAKETDLPVHASDVEVFRKMTLNYLIQQDHTDRP